jgi:YjbE family integral membrane protein
LQVTGLMFAGGLLLLWVGWKMYRDIRGRHIAQLTEVFQTRRTYQVVWRILIADISMSLDNVLGVAGVARDHTRDLVIGLAFSVVLMGVASSFISRLTEKYPKIAYVGVAIILYTATNMMWDGAQTLGWIA